MVLSGYLLAFRPITLRLSMGFNAVMVLSLPTGSPELPQPPEWVPARHPQYPSAVRP